MKEIQGMTGLGLNFILEGRGKQYLVTGMSRNLLTRLTLITLINFTTKIILLCLLFY